MSRLSIIFLFILLTPSLVNPTKETPPGEQCEIWGYVLDHSGKVRPESFNIALSTYPNPGFKECYNDPNCYNLHARTFPDNYYCFIDVPKPHTYELIIDYTQDIDHGNPPKRDMVDDIFPPENKVIINLTKETKPLRHDFHAVRVASVKGRLLWQNAKPIGDIHFTPADPAFFNPFANPYDPITESDGSFQVSGLAPGCGRLLEFTVNINMDDPDSPYSATSFGRVISGLLFGLLDSPEKLVDQMRRKNSGNETLSIIRTLELPCMEEGASVDLGDLKIPNFSRDELVLKGYCYLNKIDTPLPDANVQLSNDQYTFVYGNIQEDGSFNFYSVPEGEYTLRASHAIKSCPECDPVIYEAKAEVNIEPGKVLNKDLILTKKE